VSKNSILLLEDDEILSETITEYLQEQGFEIEAVYNGQEALERAYEKSFDLYLLDVNVAVVNGFEFLKLQREKNDQTPAIFITSLNDIDSFEEGFKSGGDDYIRKPFELKELLLRIKSLLKRGYFHSKNELVKIDDDIFFDTDSLELIIKNKPQNLSQKELKLLKLLLNHPNTTLSHEQITSHLWSYEETPSETSLRTYIKNLRHLIGKERIVSIKRVGYRYNPK
jgi:DNA-binding response OmpR family regulator